jgi:hypothetical protein
MRRCAYWVQKTQYLGPKVRLLARRQAAEPPRAGYDSCPWPYRFGAPKGPGDGPAQCRDLLPDQGLINGQAFRMYEIDAFYSARSEGGR